MKKHITAAVLAAFSAVAAPAWSADIVAGFENLATPPAVNGVSGLYFANSSSDTYLGIDWDRRFRVVGDAVRVDADPSNPLYGLPHTGHYFVTNEGDGTANEGLMITTSLVMTSAWFGRNEYRGFGAGADQITIWALHGNTPIVGSSIVFDLPAPAVAGQPGVLALVDTSSFKNLSGITGYRIDRHSTDPVFNGNWVADDFTFAAAAPVPEPETYAMLLAGLGVLAWARRRTR